MNENMVLTYPGLSESEKVSMLSPYRLPEKDDDRRDILPCGLVATSKVEYPKAPNKEDLYFDLGDDDEAALKTKKHRRARFRDAQASELKQKIEDLDSVRVFVGITFEKGEPKEVNVKALPGALQKKLLGKKNRHGVDMPGLIGMGVLEEGGGGTEKVTKPPKPFKK